MVKDAWPTGGTTFRVDPDWDDEGGIAEISIYARDKGEPEEFLGCLTMFTRQARDFLKWLEVSGRMLYGVGPQGSPKS
jgi:hypothetical protein